MYLVPTRSLSWFCKSICVLHFTATRDRLAANTDISPNIQLKQEPAVQQRHPTQQQHQQQPHSPPLQQRYMLPNTTGMVPAPAHIGFIPTTQSQVHLSTHPLPAHLPAFLQQGTAAQFTVNPSHAAYLTQAGMIGGLPAATAGLAASRTNRQPGFPGYLYPGFE